MKNIKYSIIHLLIRFTLIINILMIIIGVSFILLHNNNLIPYISSPQYKNFIPSLNKIILVTGSFLILLNIFLFITTIIYSNQKYFKLLEKINFEDIESSITLAKNIKSLDEFGYMGEKLKVLLDIYLKYSNLKKLRILFEQKKFNFLMNLMDNAALIITKKDSNNIFLVKYINNKALDALNLKEKRSMLLGKSFDSIIDSLSRDVFNEILSTLTYEKQRDFSINPIRSELSIDTNLSEAKAVSNKEGKKVVKKDYKNFNVEIYPFIFSWLEEIMEETDEKIKERENSVLDSLLLFISKKK